MRAPPPLPILASLLYVAGLAAACVEAPSDATARVDEIFAQWDSSASPGCALSVSQAGSPLISRAWGMSDLEHDIPNTPSTIFEGGSLAKQFTSAAVVLLEELSRSGVPLSELRRPFDRYAASGEVNFTVEDPRAVTEALAHRYRDHPQDRLDGLTVDCGDWWFNLRPSNTEPLLRLNLEARSAGDCTRRLTELRAAVRSTR